MLFRSGAALKLISLEAIDVNKGNDPPIVFALNKDGKILKALMSRPDLDINKLSTAKKTPFIHAAERGYLRAVQILSESPRVDVNALITGTTALHLAIRNHDAEMVRFLLTVRNIDVNIKDKMGRTPLKLAKSERTFFSFDLDAKAGREIVRLLKAAGAK